MRHDGRIHQADDVISSSSGRRRSIGIALALVPAFLTIQMHLHARQSPEAKWVGKWVLPKHEDYQLQDEAGGIVFGQGRFDHFQVERRDGKRLWIRSGTFAGWIDADQVVTVESAIEYFSSAIKNNANDWYAYAARGAVKQGLPGGFDASIADFTDAIRLSPREPNLYYFRALGHHWKRSYDKAIADFNQAIRLVPRQPAYFYRRGHVWLAKKDYENAIADFTDAIRLDPQNAENHNSRAWVLATCPEAEHRDGKTHCRISRQGM